MGLYSVGSRGIMMLINFYRLKFIKKILSRRFGIPESAEVFKIKNNSVHFWKNKSCGEAVCRVFQEDVISFLLSTLNEQGSIDTASVNNKDDLIDQTSPNTNYGTSIALAVARNATYPNSYYRSLIHFTLSADPGSTTITAIKLFLYKYADVSGYSCPACEVHELTQTAWTEAGATWNKYDGVNNWGTAGGDYSATIVDTTNTPLAYGNYGWENWDLGAGATNPIAGLTWNSNVHLLLKYPSSSTQSYVQWYSRNNATNKPYIEITYTVTGNTGAFFQLF